MARSDIRSAYSTLARVTSALGMTGTIWPMLFYFQSQGQREPLTIAYRRKSFTQNQMSCQRPQNHQNEMRPTVKVDIQIVATINAVDERTPKSHGGRVFVGIALNGASVRMMPRPQGAPFVCRIRRDKYRARHRIKMDDVVEVRFFVFWLGLNKGRKLLQSSGLLTTKSSTACAVAFLP